MEEIAITIEGIPFKACEQDLLWILQKYINLNADQIIYFLPLDNYIQAEIICSSKVDYERLINLKTYELADMFETIRFNKSSLNVSKDHQVNFGNLEHLPWEVLHKIFKYCSLKDQLNLAKVCKSFFQLISHIWHRKFTAEMFTYDYHEFKYKLKWNDKIIRDLFIVAGNHLRKVRFMTYVNMDVLHGISDKLAGNPMVNLKNFINKNFRSEVKHFRNLIELEVWGNFLTDVVIIDLIKYCKHIKTINFHDSSNLWFKGLHLSGFKKLENLCLKGCQNLDCIQFLRTSKNCQLKELNIVQCNALYNDVELMIDYTKYWQFLNTLKITAFTADRRLMKALLALPVLKNLQFFWINFLPIQFEENLFMELYENEEKCRKLIQLQYENDRYNIETEGTQEWTPLAYEVMREIVSINGEQWHWTNDTFNIFSTRFNTFSNLSEIHYNYCRLLNYEQLKMLPKLNKNLQLIQIRGYPLRNDQQFHKEWCYDAIANHCKCQLKFVNTLSYEDVAELRSEAESREYSSYYRRDPVLRSLACYFQ